jgi:hypothetical protein
MAISNYFLTSTELVGSLSRVIYPDDLKMPLLDISDSWINPVYDQKQFCSGEK